MFIILLVCFVAGVESSCKDGWTHFQASCYFFGHTDQSFQDAQRYCQHFGANLVNVETGTENSFLRSYLNDLKESRHWIGITDELIEGVWKQYPSEATATFTDFSSGQPNDGRSANCAAYWQSHNYHWVDESCTNRFKALCEMPFEEEHVVG